MGIRYLTGDLLDDDAATKDDWRDPSRLEWIQSILDDLRAEISTGRMKSIALPPLGCGLGGLRWPTVRSMIEQTLGDLPNVEVRVYGKGP